MAKDLFSQQASIYARYRPVYPAVLFEYIISFVQQRHIAWDCATGNGQAAVALATYFEKVEATDLSEKQLQQAIAHPNVSYAVSPADTTPFPDHHFDCITVAQAYHWFPFEAFHREVLRVAKPGAIIAVWGYSLVQCTDTILHSLIDTFYRDTVGPYWDKERKYVDDQYATVPFPYKELPSRSFSIEVSWTKEDLLGYLNTWSGLQHFLKAHGYNPVDELATVIRQHWVADTAKAFSFPLFLRLGVVE